MYVLPEHDDVTENAKHLVDPRGFVDTFEDGRHQVGDITSNGRPTHIVVLSFQNVVNGPRCKYTTNNI